MTYASKFRVTLILTLIASYASGEDRQKALIDRAKRLSDIRSEGAAPFKLTAKFRAADQQAATTQGSYEELWVSRAERRREMSSANSNVIEIEQGHQRWVIDPIAAPDTRFGRLGSVIDFSFTNPRFKKLKRIADRQVQGVIAECVVSEPDPRGAKEALCFDKNTGFLLERIYPDELGNQLVDEACEYSNYQSFADKSFPRAISCFQGQRMTLTGTLELTPLTPDPSLFTPPEGAKESVNCLDSPVIAPKATFAPDPAYPKGQGHPDHPVVFWMVVGTDGRPRDLKVVRSINDAFDNAALEAIKRWTFQPASCAGQPLAVQINVEMTFWH
jgi:TonB family protein